MEATVEELQSQHTAAQIELADVRSEFELTNRALAAAQQEVSERNVRISELESALKDYDQRGHRISELEAQAADLAENLAGSDEKLGTEVKAREEAQREANRLQEELDQRGHRISELDA